MGASSRAEQEALQRKYKDICADLNLDKSAADEALSSFHRIGNNYTLEGDKLHWLACALYVACRKSRTPTVKGNLTDGNFVSLTRLLRSCNLSLVQFFVMMKKWADMANLSQDMRNKIEYLERNFNVTTIIFKKYRPLFVEVFRDHPISPQKASKGKKQRGRQYITSDSLFTFCWTLFVQVKSNFSAISADLVNSYHLLIACIDFCFNNALNCELSKELLNPTFAGLPSGFDQDDFVSPDRPICIVKTLCDKFQGIYVDAKGIKEHWWKPYLRRIVEKKLVRCHDLDELLGFFDLANFDYNCKSISKKYDTYVLNFGDFDERVFLCNDGQDELGTASADSLSQQLTQIRAHLEQKKSLVPATPLTNRHLLQNRDQAPATPVSNATQTVSRLQSLLIGYSDQPSTVLLRLLERCKENPREAIEQRVKRLGDRFVNAYCSTNSDCDENAEADSDSRSLSPPPLNEFAQRRLQLAVTLYYKTLENITKREVKRLSLAGGDVSESLSAVLTNSMFHVSLFACCAEIVLFAYKSKRVFPWIIDIYEDFDGLHFQPGDFYKVIELIIRDEEGFSRDVVKHLNLVEEKILECLVWKSDSNIWEKIRQHGSVPSCQDVALPLTQEGQNPPQSPLTAIRQLHQSSDRFMSPVANTSIRRRLFDSTPQPKPENKAPPSSNSQNQVVQLALQTPDTGEVRYIISYPQNQPTSSSTPETVASSSTKSSKVGPLGLFFRKVYYLAWTRMKDLCDRLEINKEEELRKIWTCFETSLRNSTDLLKDRHIDQLIMCTIYSMCKINSKHRTFYEIMGAYRFQPQYQSHVYRSILLGPAKEASSSSPVKNGTSEASSSNGKLKHPSTPSRPVGSSSVESGEQRGDIIMFYNQIYVTKMKKYILRFFEDSNSPPLSPLPRLSSHPISPYRRISSSHPVFVSPLKSANLPASPKKPSIYCFSVSPANDLKLINQMVKGQPSTSAPSLPNNLANSFAGLLSNGNVRKVGKRIFQDSENENSPTKRVCADPSLLTSKIENVFSDRTQVAHQSDSVDSNLD